MAEIFTNLKKGTDIQVQEAQKFPNKMKPKNPIPRYVTIKMTKTKKIILKEARAKQSVTKESHKAIS